MHPAGQGSLEYMLLISGALLVAVIVITATQSLPQITLASGEYGLASSQCIATFLDVCWGKKVPSGSNTYYCYLDEDKNQCLTQNLGPSGCDNRDCETGENCSQENDLCEAGAGVCQRNPGLCLNDCRYQSLPAGTQPTGCDETSQTPPCDPIPCECNGKGNCVHKDCAADQVCSPHETCLEENIYCIPTSCQTNPQCLDGCHFDNIPGGTQIPDKCDNTTGCGVKPCECNGLGACVHRTLPCPNGICAPGEVCPGGLGIGDDPYCNQPPQHKTCQVGACTAGCEYTNIPPHGVDDGNCDATHKIGSCTIFPCECDGAANCVGHIPLSSCTDPGWLNNRTYDLTADLSSTGPNCFGITGNNIVLDCKNHTITAALKAIIIEGTGVTIQNCSLKGTASILYSTVEVVDTGTNATIKDSNIINLTSDVAGIEAYAGGLTVKDSNVYALKYGIWLQGTTADANISHNQITVVGIIPRGIQLSNLSYAAPGLKINNNNKITVTSTSGLGLGIGATGVNGPGIIAQNQITVVSGSNTGRGLSITGTTDKIGLNSNTITVTSTAPTPASYGIYLTGNDNNINSNTVSLSSNSSTASHAVYVGSNDNNVTGNIVSMTSSNTGSHAIYLYSSATNSLVKNNNVCGGSRQSIYIFNSSDPQVLGSNGNTCAATKCGHFGGVSNVCINMIGDWGNCNSNC